MAQCKYTPEELDNHAIDDQIIDAECAERQALEGPFYPDRGITRESLLRYAAECRATAARYSGGGLHDAVIKGEA